MKITKIALLLLFATVFLWNCEKETPTIPVDSSPQILSIAPELFFKNDIVTIKGKNYGSEKGDSKVYFNEILAENIIVWNDSLITLVVPDVNNDGNIKVVTSFGTSNLKSFTLDNGPRVISAGNGRAYPEQIIEIKGENFGSNKGTVLFNGVEATNFYKWTENIISLEVPKDATSGMLIVKVGNKMSKGYYFTVAKDTDPFVNMITPSTTYTGDDIKITGKNFGEFQGSSYVDFNGIPASEYLIWTKDSLRVKVPPGAATGYLRVFIKNQGSNTIKITVSAFGPPPEITNVNNTAFKIGEEIIINGKNFGASKVDAADVLFNGIPAIDYKSWSATTIVVVVPNDAVTGKLLIKIGDQVSNTIDYTILK